MASRELKVEIIGDSRSLERALGNAGSSATNFGSKFAKAGRVVGLAALGMGAAVTAGLVYTLKRGFDELGESQQVMAQTAAALVSTGQAANVTAKDVESLANSLSKLTGIDDEAIQASENMLLTFTSVRNEVGKGNDIFDQATVAIADMATRMNDGAIPSAEQLSQTAIRVGKALNDPIAGMGALSRVGVRFTDSQKATIKSLVESGKSMEAQKLILKELTTEFGGSAKAAGDTLPGQLAKARNAFDEIASKLALKFLPILTEILEWVDLHWPQIGAVFDAVGDVIIGTFDVTREAVEKLTGILREHPDIAKAAAGAILGIGAALVIATAAQTAFNIAAMANPYVLIVIGAAAAVGALVALYLTSERARDTMNKVFEDIRAVVMPILEVLKEGWRRFGDALIQIGRTFLLALTLPFRNVFDTIRGMFNIFAGLFTGDFGRMWEGIKQVFAGQIGNTLGLLRSWISSAGALAKAVGAAIVDGIVAGATGLAGKVAEVMQKVWDALRTAATTAYNFAKEIGSKIVTGIWDGFKSLIGGIKDKISSAIGGILSSIDIPGLSPPEHAAAETIGKPLALGAARGFKENVKELAAALGIGIKEAVNHGKQIAAYAQEVGWKVALEAANGLRQQTPSFMQQMRDFTQAGIDAAKAKVEEAKGQLASAMANMASAALAAFDAVTNAWQSPTEKLLEKLRLDDAKKAVKKAVSDAQSEFDKLIAESSAASLARDAGPPPGMSPEEWQKEYDRLTGIIDTNGPEILAAQQRLADALHAQDIFNLEQKAIKEREAYELERGRKRTRFAEELADLEKWAITHRGHHRELLEKVRRMWAKFGVDARTMGQDWGQSLVDGMYDSIPDILDAARAVANAMKGIDPGPRPKRPDRSSASSGDDGRGGRMSASGGIVVNVYGSVTSERDLVTSIRNAMVQEGRRSGGNLMGGYA